MSYTGYTYLNFQVNESITSPLVSNPSFSICSKVISKSFSFVALKISSSCQQKNSTSNEVFLGGDIFLLKFLGSYILPNGICFSGKYVQLSRVTYSLFMVKKR